MASSTFIEGYVTHVAGYVLAVRVWFFSERRWAITFASQNGCNGTNTNGQRHTMRMDLFLRKTSTSTMIAKQKKTTSTNCAVIRAMHALRNYPSPLAVEFAERHDEEIVACLSGILGEE